MIEIMDVTMHNESIDLMYDLHRHLSFNESIFFQI